MKTARQFWEECWTRFDPEPIQDIPSVFSSMSSPTEQFLAFLPAGAAIIDFGCGWGRNALFLARRGYRVGVSDISQRAMTRCLSLAKKERLDVFPVPYGNERIGNCDDYFQGALAWSVLDHMSMEEAIAAVAEMARVCSPGAIILCSFDGLEDIPGSEPHKVLDDGTIQFSGGSREGMLVRHYDPVEIRGLLEPGWTVLDLFGNRPADRKTVLCRKCGGGAAYAR